MLSADLADEVDVAVLPGGRLEIGHDNSSDRLYNEDSVFLCAVIESLRREVERLEKEVGCRRSRKNNPTRR